MDNIRQTFTDASTVLSKAVKGANIQDEASVVFNRAKQVSCQSVLAWHNFLIITKLVNISK